MLKGRCPDCGQPIETERREGATFRCAACGSSFRLVLKEGKLVARHVEPPPSAGHGAAPRPESMSPHQRLDSWRAAQSAPAAPPPLASQGEPSYWGSMTGPSGAPARAEEKLPYTLPAGRKSSAPPRAPSRSPSAAKGGPIEVLPRIGWFLLLFGLLALNVLHIPMFQLVYNHQDVTLPGIGTLSGKADLERPGQSGITTGYVTETKLVARARKGDSYQVRYRFQVNGQTYTYGDGQAGQDAFADIKYEAWLALDQATKSGRQATLDVKYLLANPWENRPVAGYAAVNDGWLFVWIVVGFLSLVSLEQAGHAYVNYRKATQAATQGKTGKLSYWEFRPKKA